MRIGALERKRTDARHVVTSAAGRCLPRRTPQSSLLAPHHLTHMHIHAPQVRHWGLPGLGEARDRGAQADRAGACLGMAAA